MANMHFVINLASDHRIQNNCEICEMVSPGRLSKPEIDVKLFVGLSPNLLEELTALHQSRSW